MKYTVGICSKCGGDIQVPSHWFGTTPPERKCSRCGFIHQAIDDWRKVEI